MIGSITVLPIRRRRWASRLALFAAATAAIVTTSSAWRGEPRGEREPGFDSPGEAMEWVLLAHRDERGNIPRDGLMRARAQVNAMRRASDADALRKAASGQITAAGITRGAWTWVGPTNIGGRVRALVIHPGAPSTLIAGGVAGGIWKSTNGGGSWRVIDDFMANLAVSCMVLRPGEANRLFAGTGEGFFNADSIRGAGIFTSTDVGESWSQLPSTANVDFDFVNRLAFSSDGNTLLAATRTGLFRSADLGGSWSQVLGQGNMMDVKFIPGSNALAVASGRNRNAYVSNNGGQTWTPSTGLSFTSSSMRVELAVSASAPNVVFASLDETSGQIWKSTDNGATFFKVSDSVHLSGQGWYDNAIWVDPTNPDHLVAGGVSLFRSTNGGTTFSTISHCHVDQHAIVHDPGYNGASNRRVYFASDGGVCKMEDVTVNSVTSLRNGLGITQFYAGGAHTGSGRLIGGTQDNGTLVYSVGAGSNAWSSQHGSDGGFAAIDPTDSNILYGETQNFRIFRTLTGGPPSQFIYGGSGSTSCSKPVPFQITDACNGNANFIAPFILDPNEPNRLLAGGRSLWRTNDSRTANTPTTGPSWHAIKGPTPSNSNISAIAVAAGNPDIIWVGHNNGDVYVALNGTSDPPIWTRTDFPLPNRTVTSLAIDSADPRIVYAAFGGFSPDSLWRTTNGGSTWEDVTGSGSTGLPDAPIRSVVLHPNQPDWIYAASDVGVFASEDGGATWTLPHDGPANVAVFQLLWMDSTLVAVTHGRGFYTTPAASLFPGFARRPRSQAVLPGHAVAFNVVAVGAGPLSYQWYRGHSGDTSSPIAGATSGSFTTPPVTETTSFWVRVTNLSGSSDSNTATLTVIGWNTLVPAISNQDGSTDPGRLTATSRLSTGARDNGNQLGGSSTSGLPVNGAPVTGAAFAAPGAGVAWLVPPVPRMGDRAAAGSATAATPTAPVAAAATYSAASLDAAWAVPVTSASATGLPGVVVSPSRNPRETSATLATVERDDASEAGSVGARVPGPIAGQLPGATDGARPAATTPHERYSPEGRRAVTPIDRRAGAAPAEAAAIESVASSDVIQPNADSSDALPTVLIVLGLTVPAILVRLVVGGRKR